MSFFGGCGILLFVLICLGSGFDASATRSFSGSSQEDGLIPDDGFEGTGGFLGSGSSSRYIGLEESFYDEESGKVGVRPLRREEIEALDHRMVGLGIGPFLPNRISEWGFGPLTPQEIETLDAQ